MNVVASVTTAVETALPTDESLWSLEALFIADWSAVVTVSTSWKTDIVGAQSTAETRAGMRTRPGRVVGALIHGMRENDVRLIRAHMMRAGSGHFLMPLYCDATRTTADSTVSTTVIPCDTTNRRLFVGATIAAVSVPSGAGSTAQFLGYYTIASLTATAITVTSSITVDIPAYSRVYPLVECTPNLKQSATVVTDGMLNLTVQATEVVGEAGLLAVAAQGAFPGAFPTTTSGLPLLDLPFGWDSLQVGVVRPAWTAQFGIDEIYQLKGARPLTSMTLDFKLRRPQAFLLMQFFDAARGRLLPFMLSAPTGDLMVVADCPDTTHVQVASVGALVDWTFFPVLMVWQRSTGLIFACRVSGVTRATGVDTYALTDALPSALPMSDIRRCTLGIVARFDTDELQEQWQTDGLMYCTLPVFETQDVTSTIGVTPLSPGETYSASSPGEGTSGTPIPDQPTGYVQLITCDGLMANIFIDQSLLDDGTTYLYASDLDAAYTADTSNVVSTVPAGATILTGWEVIPYPPGNDANPDFVPACVAGTGTLGNSVPAACGDGTMSTYNVNLSAGSVVTTGPYVNHEVYWPAQVITVTVTGDTFTWNSATGAWVGSVTIAGTGPASPASIGSIQLQCVTSYFPTGSGCMDDVYSTGATYTYWLLSLFDQGADDTEFSFALTARYGLTPDAAGTYTLQGCLSSPAWDSSNVVVGSSPSATVAASGTATVST